MAQDQDQNLKIQPWIPLTSTTGFAKYFENIVKSLHFFKGSMAFEVDPYLSSRHIKMQVIIVLQTACNNTENFFIPVWFYISDGHWQISTPLFTAFIFSVKSSCALVTREEILFLGLQKWLHDAFSLSIHSVLLKTVFRNSIANLILHISLNLLMVASWFHKLFLFPFILQLKQYWKYIVV